MPHTDLRRGVYATLLSAALVAVPLATPTFAANIVKDEGASERLNFSGKLRMLSQRIPAAACNFAAGVAPEAAKKVLEGAVAEFELITDALEFGNPEMNVHGKEERRKTLAAIAALRSEWEPIGKAAHHMLDAQPGSADTEVIATSNMALLSKAKLLVSELSGQYSDPTAMLQADAMLVDIAGRQRMLTQKMSKESCLIWSGLGGDGGADALAGTMNLFEVSLLALRDGLSAAGVKPAPTDEIHAGLDAIHTEWQALKPTLQTAVDGGDADAETRSQTFAELNTLLKNMNDVVTLYSDFAKPGL